MITEMKSTTQFNLDETHYAIYDPSDKTLVVRRRRDNKSTAPGRDFSLKATLDVWKKVNAVVESL